MFRSDGFRFGARGRRFFTLSNVCLCMMYVCMVYDGRRVLLDWQWCTVGMCARCLCLCLWCRIAVRCACECVAYWMNCFVYVLLTAHNTFGSDRYECVYDGSAHGSAHLYVQICYTSEWMKSIFAFFFFEWISKTSIFFLMIFIYHLMCY